MELFRPDRMASRMLGMGDIVSLVERAQETMDQEEAEAAAAKLSKGQFTLEDFASQLRQVKKMGPLENVLGMLPGAGKLKDMAGAMPSEQDMAHLEAIILSMTLEERRHPDIIDGRRKRRIASGSGRQVQEVNQVLKGFDQMRQLMKQLRGGRLPRIPGLPAVPGGRQ
jgi:signal recognition particle subunit SRP54